MTLVASIPTEIVDVEDVALPVKSGHFMDYVMSLIEEWDSPEGDAEATLMAADEPPKDNDAAKLSIVKTAAKVKVLQTEAKQEAKKAQDYTDKAKPHAMKSRKLTEQSKEISKKNEEMVKEVAQKDVIRAQQAAESIKRKAMLMASKAKDQANQVVKDAAENAAMAGAAVPSVTSVAPPVDVQAVKAAEDSAKDSQKTLDQAKEVQDEAKQSRDSLLSKAARATGAQKVDLEAEAKDAGVKVTAARREVEKDAEDVAKKSQATAKAATAGIDVGPIKKDASIHIHVHYPK